MAKPSKGKDLDETKRLMAALGRMPPKQHKDMKLGKRTAEPKASPNPRKSKKDDG